jgi:hypothetical protein
MVKPIAPSEVSAAQVALFPDFVMETWNTAIAKNWSGNQSHILQDDIIHELIAASPGLIDRGDVFARHWLDIEDLYRAEGWAVEYDKPAYNESYDACFVFKKK